MKVHEPALDDISTWDDPDTDDLQIQFHPPAGERDWPPVEHWTRQHWTTWLEQHEGWTKPRIDQYLDVDRFQYGLGFKRHPTEKYTYFYLPVPAAVPFHAARATNVAYGGAVGGTKSHSTRFDAYRYCVHIDNYQSLLMRRTHEELNRNHTLKAVQDAEAVNHFFGDVIIDAIPSAHLIKFPKNGSLITLGHCQNPGDEERYLGPEYDDFRPDEMATFLKDQVVGVAGRLRSTKRTNDYRVMARLLGTTNPGGADAQWIKSWFIDKNVDRAENRMYDPADYEFIRASLYDNPYLMDPDGTYTEYEKKLYRYSPQRRKQLLNGDWNAITGQFFPEWNQHLHVGVLHIPEGCKIERWIDWGYSPNPGVCHWVAALPNGRLYVFAEWVFNGEGRPLRVAGKVAARIAEMTKEQILKSIPHARLNKSVGDPSMFAKDGHTGESYEETFRRNGVRLKRGDNDRVQGWGRMRHWLGRHPEGGAWLMYHPDCTYAIRTIPALVHDKNDPDDCDTSGEDHAGDADRYGLMDRPTPTRYIYRPQPSLPDSLKQIVGLTSEPKVRPFGKIM